jgi:hypothetical protein
MSPTLLDTQSPISNTQPTITWYTTSPDAGHPGCTCSLCGQPITDVPIRIFANNIEARFHPACFQKSGLLKNPGDVLIPLSNPAQGYLPGFYRPPLGLPYNWRDELTGQIPAAVNAYLDHRVDPANPPPTPTQFAILQAYLVHYINAPCWDGSGFTAELAQLRAAIQRAQTPDDLARWIHDCLQIGIDPL